MSVMRAGIGSLFTTVLERLQFTMSWAGESRLAQVTQIARVEIHRFQVVWCWLWQPFQVENMPPTQYPGFGEGCKVKLNFLILAGILLP